jgi:hypothetical protein
MKCLSFGEIGEQLENKLRRGGSLLASILIESASTTTEVGRIGDRQEYRETFAGQEMGPPPLGNASELANPLTEQFPLPGNRPSVRKFHYQHHIGTLTKPCLQSSLEILGLTGSQSAIKRRAANLGHFAPDRLIGGLCISESL